MLSSSVYNADSCRLFCWYLGTSVVSASEPLLCRELNKQFFSFKNKNIPRCSARMMEIYVSDILQAQNVVFLASFEKINRRKYRRNIKRERRQGKSCFALWASPLEKHLNYATSERNKERLRKIPSSYEIFLLR